MPHTVAPVTINEPDARRVLAEALRALGWARDWRESAQDEGPTGAQTGAENWTWYCRGSANAAEHDRRCAEETLRKVLGLPSVEDDED